MAKPEVTYYFEDGYIEILLPTSDRPVRVYEYIMTYPGERICKLEYKRVDYGVEYRYVDISTKEIVFRLKEWVDDFPIKGDYDDEVPYFMDKVDPVFEAKARCLYTIGAAMEGRLWWKPILEKDLKNDILRQHDETLGEGIQSPGLEGYP